MGLSLKELREMPTTIKNVGSSGAHESVLRSFMLVEKLRVLLEQQPPTPPHVLLEIIDDVTNAPHLTLDLKADH